MWYWELFIDKNENIVIVNYVPPWGPGGLSRECILRIPMRAVKGD